MKKLILILFAFIALTGYSQRVDVNYSPYKTLTTYTVDGDTTIYVKTSTAYVFESQFKWYNLTNLDGSVKYKYSTFNNTSSTPPNDSLFVDYPMDSLLLNAASGTAFMRDMEKGTGANWLGIYIDSGTETGGSLIMNLNIIPKR